MLTDLTLPEALALLAALAGVLNRVVEYVFGTLFDRVEKLKPYKWALMYIVLILGVFAALQFDLDLLAVLDFPASTFGRVLTGIILSGGAQLINDAWPKPKLKAGDVARAILDEPLTK